MDESRFEEEKRGLDKFLGLMRIGPTKRFTSGGTRRKVESDCPRALPGGPKRETQMIYDMIHR